MWKVCFLHLYEWNLTFSCSSCVQSDTLVLCLWHFSLVWCQEKSNFPSLWGTSWFQPPTLTVEPLFYCLLSLAAWGPTRSRRKRVEPSAWSTSCLPSTLCSGWVSTPLGLGAPPAAPERWRAFCKLFKSTSDSTSESAETWGRRLRAQAVMMTWSVS